LLKVKLENERSRREEGKRTQKSRDTRGERVNLRRFLSLTYRRREEIQNHSHSLTPLCLYRPNLHTRPVTLLEPSVSVVFFCMGVCMVWVYGQNNRKIALQRC